MIVLKHTHLVISELIIILKFERKKKTSKFDIFESLSVHEFDNVAISESFIDDLQTGKKEKGSMHREEKL